MVLPLPVSFGQESNRLRITCRIATQPSAMQLLGVQMQSLVLQLLPLPQLSYWLALE